MVKTRRKPAAQVLALRKTKLAVREQFERAVEDLGGVEGLAQSFPAVRGAVMEAIDGALPSDAEEVFRPRVERRLAPLFRLAGLDPTARLGLVTFAILHKSWEAQRLYLEAVGQELQHARKAAARRR